MTEVVAPTRERLVAACAFLPIFPLSRTVLMPGALLPLHVFEPRYRAMLAHCLAGNRMMGIATLKPDGRRGEQRPGVYEEMGVGLVVAHQALSDGRSNLVLKSVGRARIVEEFNTEHRFRLVRAELADDDASGLTMSASVLRSLVTQIGSYNGEAADEAQRLCCLDDVPMVDELARRLVEHPDEQLSYLAMDRVDDRAQLVIERLAALIRPVGDGPVN